LRHAKVEVVSHCILATVVSTKYLLEKHAQSNQWCVDAVALMWGVLLYQGPQRLAVKQGAEGIGSSLGKSIQYLFELR